MLNFVVEQQEDESHYAVVFKHKGWRFKTVGVNLSKELAEMLAKNLNKEFNKKEGKVEC